MTIAESREAFSLQNIFDLIKGHLERKPSRSSQVARFFGAPTAT